MKYFVPEAILFDLDGVLIDSIKHHFHSWQIILSEFNVEVSLRDIALGEGERADDSMRRFLRERANLEIPEDQLQDLLTRKRAIFKQNNPPKIIPDAHQLLEFLRAHSIKIALVTGSALVNVQNSLTKNDLALFDTIVTGDAHLPGKPDPAPYLKAMDDLQLPADKCWVVENAPFGIRAAKAAGAFTVAVTSTLAIEDLPGADIHLPAIGSVQELFAKAISS